MNLKYYYWYFQSVIPEEYVMKLLDMAKSKKNKLVLQVDPTKIISLN
jgi:hypothetical protein